MRSDEQTCPHLSTSDQEILQLFSDPSKKEAAFRLLLGQFQKPIYYYIRRMVLDHDDADDITQNTFIKAWKGLANFRGESKISTWLHRIAYNESISFINSSKRIGKVDIGNVEHELTPHLQQDVLYSGDEIQMKLQTALATLPEKQKAVFIMKYYEEKKYEEISQITGTSVGALKASFHHAVTKIELFLNAQ
ncbi:MAG: RNA polymerase sigma factor [Flavobacteriales bacterium]